MAEFKPVTLGRARWLAEQFGAERLVIITTSGDLASSGKNYTITSYGSSLAVCKRLGAMIEAGKLDDAVQEIADA